MCSVLEAWFFLSWWLTEPSSWLDMVSLCFQEQKCSFCDLLCGHFWNILIARNKLTLPFSEINCGSDSIPSCAAFWSNLLLQTSLFGMTLKRTTKKSPAMDSDKLSGWGFTNNTGWWIRTQQILHLEKSILQTFKWMVTSSPWISCLRATRAFWRKLLRFLHFNFRFLSSYSGWFKRRLRAYTIPVDTSPGGLNRGCSSGRHRIAGSDGNNRSSNTRSSP